MKRENLISYLSDPGLLNQSSLPEVEELIRAFPYFQTAHMLLARNHHNLDSLKFHEMLGSAAAFAGDRTVLYHLIKDESAPAAMKESRHAEQGLPPGEIHPPEESMVPESTGPTVPSEETPQEGNIPDVLEEMPGLDAGTGELDYTPAYTLEEYTFTGWFDHLGEPTGKSSPQSGKDKLIDKFLEEQPGIKADPDKAYDATDRSEAFTVAGDSLMTETLARIYLKQGLLRKAIYAYEKLSLKYPEKSTYFATLINQIKNRLEEK